MKVFDQGHHFVYTTHGAVAFWLFAETFFQHGVVALHNRIIDAAKTKAKARAKVVVVDFPA